MVKQTDPSDRICIENLRPKTVPEQLIALGTVLHVSDIQIRIQVTGGIICLVDKYHISKAYTDSWKRYEADYKIGKQPLEEPPRLSQLFKRGEQYVCKILDRETRKGYAEAQDIIASIDPEHIQEDNVPNQILTIPNVPLQGSIISLEDHGYRVDLGFKNITGFLKYDESDEYCINKRDGEKFLVGQIVRCCTRDVLLEGAESRIIQLSLRKEILKAGKFSKDKCRENALTPRTILPGSIGYLTVMNVQKDGLIVNFLDEFAGFVSVNHLGDDLWQDPIKSHKVSDQRKCTVLYYNQATNTFALSLKTQKYFRKTLKHFLETYHIGQVVKDAQVTHLNGLRSVNFVISSKYRALTNVKDALDQDIATMSKDELHLALDAAYQDRSKHKARIKSINLADLILVLSLRQDFLELSCVSVDELEPSDFLEVQVKKHVKDGVVVTFGLNLRAIILNNHLKDYISQKQSIKCYPVGMPLKCRVLKIDPDKHPTRVYLTNKEQLMDPEMTVIDAYEPTFRGETVDAIVVKLKTNGLIVELFNNVKGFIPLRFCSSANLRTVTDLFEIGQVVTCTAYRIEPDRQTMSMSVVPYDKIVEIMKEKKKAKRERARLKELNKIDRKIDANSKREKKRKDQCAEGNAKTKRQRARVTSDDGDDENKLEDSRKKAKLSSVESVPGKMDVDEEIEEDNATSGIDSDEQQQDKTAEELSKKPQKSRFERSREAKEREERIRQVELSSLDPNRKAKSIGDFERLVLKEPNNSAAWIEFSKFFLDNVETEKARIVCRRALDTISFRKENEKLGIWLHMILIEAKFGGIDRLRQLVEEAAQTNDKLELYRRASEVLVTCGELDESERMHEHLLHKLGGKKVPEAWLEYLVFLMENRKDLHKARTVYESAVRNLEQQLEEQPSRLINFRSRFARLEFQHGDVERGKTLFENLLSEHPKRMDLWSVYEGAIRKFGTRQLDTDEVRQQNAQILERIASLKN